jgi:hypothetical protein
MDGIQSVIPLNHEAATDDKSLLSDTQFSGFWAITIEQP